MKRKQRIHNLKKIWNDKAQKESWGNSRLPAYVPKNIKS